MKLRPFLPAAAVISALAATTAAYHLAAPAADPPPPPRPDADGRPADPVAEAMLVRSVARGLVAREVIAGRTTVPEAAALFGWLDARSPWTKAAADGRIAADAGLSDSGGYTDAEMHGVRVVAAATAVAGSLPCLPPGGVEWARGEFLAARRAGSSPGCRRCPRTGASGCWRRPGPRPGR